MGFIKNLFVPHEKNNFKAGLLKPSLLAFFVGIFLLNQVVMNLFVMARPGVLGYSSDITPEMIISLTNSERERLGLSPVTENELLSEAARRKGADMFAFDYWAHTSPSGRTPWDFLKEAGYNYVVAGENLAKDFSNPEGVVSAWMKSPTHKANILDDRFKEVGVAVIEGTLNGYKTTLVIQHFGAPSVAMAAVRPVVAKEQSLIQSVNSESTNPATLSPVPNKETYISATDKSSQTPIANPLIINKGIGGFLFGLIIGALIVDTYFVFKNKYHRFSGRNVAHAGFIALMFFMILLSQQGVVN